MRDEVSMRRAYMFDRITKIPNITALKPQGTFYILVNCISIPGRFGSFPGRQSRQRYSRGWVTRS
jgi:aspartate/methionine/tyrosine aminotransferase